LRIFSRRIGGILNKKVKALDIYVVFSLTFLVAFTGVILTVFSNRGEEPTTLITFVFSTFGGEILTCALIKIFKLRRDNKNE
jgi:archaellum biogenesis protein FlaJ (TadC family)